MEAQNITLIREDTELFKRSGRPGELGTNPNVNPLLREFEIPFNHNTEVLRFFQRGDNEGRDHVRNRILELQRYVFRSVPWSASTFVGKMVSILCTKDYRLEKAFPSERS